MTKRSKLWIVATILIGGLIMLFSLNHHTEQEKLEAQMQSEQKRMVLHAINRFEDIQKIEFTSFEENKMTGTWSSIAIINNEMIVTFTLWEFNGEIGLSENSSQNNGKYLSKKENISGEKSLNNFNIVYLEEQND